MATFQLFLRTRSHSILSYLHTSLYEFKVGKNSQQLTCVEHLREHRVVGVSSKRVYTQCRGFHPFLAEASYEGYVFIPKSLQLLAEELVWNCITANCHCLRKDWELCGSEVDPESLTPESLFTTCSVITQVPLSLTPNSLSGISISQDKATGGF